MTKEEFLSKVRKKITYIFDRNSIEIELENHIKESMIDLIKEGYSNEEAEKIAVEQMGDPNIIGKLLNKEHHPIIGYCLLVSRICLIYLLLPCLLLIGSIVWDSFQMITPIKVEYTKEKIELNMWIFFGKRDSVLIDHCADIALIFLCKR